MSTGARCIGMGPRNRNGDDQAEQDTALVWVGLTDVTG
jgi:hypothetical protein